MSTIFRAIKAQESSLTLIVFGLENVWFGSQESKPENTFQSCILCCDQSARSKLLIWCHTNRYAHDLSDLLLYSPVQIILHPSSPTNSPDALCLFGYKDVTLETASYGFWNVRKLELELREDLDLPGSPCNSDTEYSFSKASWLPYIQVWPTSSPYFVVHCSVLWAKQRIFTWTSLLYQENSGALSIVLNLNMFRVGYPK